MGQTTSGESDVQKTFPKITRILEENHRSMNQSTMITDNTLITPPLPNLQIF
jgi:hypothetical protein